MASAAWRAPRPASLIAASNAMVMMREGKEKPAKEARENGLSYENARVGIHSVSN